MEVTSSEMWGLPQPTVLRQHETQVAILTQKTVSVLKNPSNETFHQREFLLHLVQMRFQHFH